MDFTNTPRDVTPHRPASGGPPHPTPNRRVFSDFAPRPAQPARPPQPQPAKPAATPAYQGPFTQRPNPMPAPVPPSPTLDQTPAQPDQPQTQHAKEAKHPRSDSAHAGLVGFICFVMLAALLLSPLVPGKILDNFPGSSQSSSSGDQAIGCTAEPTHVTSTTRYNTKVGSPIIYNYSTTTTQTGNCNGQQQSAVEGHGSQFNPLGLVIDLATALVVAIAVARVWRRIFGAGD